MEQYIKKATLVAEIEKNKNEMEPERDWHFDEYTNGYLDALKETLSFIDTLEVKDPYEQCVQYDSIKAGIQAHAETYSFNIESKLFNQLTKEQQKLWREEIEQAYISGGEVGVELARDPRYKENLEVKDDVVSTDPISPNSLNISRSGNSRIGENGDLEKAAACYAREQLRNPDYPTYNDEYEIECAFEAGAHWQALHSLETIKGMEEQAFLAGVEAEQTYKSFSKEELLNGWRINYDTE